MQPAVRMVNNKNLGKVIDVIRANIKSGTKISAISRMFSIFAFNELKDELAKIEKLRLIIPSHKDQMTFIDGINGNTLDRHLRNQLNSSTIAQECSQWLEQKCEVRTLPSSVHQNLFYLSEANEGKNVAIVGSSSFTTDGLGISPSNAHHMNTCFNSTDEAKALIDWFEDLWQSGKNKNEYQQILQETLSLIYEKKSPQLIYFFVLYNIFKDFLSELDEEKIIKTQTGIKDTQVWKKLYKFQRDGVLGAIDKLEKHNGCIIADSVGLGKTFEALAIIKYYELRNDRVLVLCPKRLRENWTIFTVNDKRNIMVNDRFNYDVLNHTDLSRLKGMSGEINLESVNWQNYDLVVIDESHNFRNNNSSKGSSQTRYSRLMNEIIKKGVKTKVLMLSATPVNNRMNDLKNQVAFIVEGKDEALVSSGITSIEQTLKKAQAKFNFWLQLNEHERTTKALLDTLNFDYFKLLDLLTIARSRKHIEKYYDITEIGKFPERLEPINVKADIDTEGVFPSLHKINRDIRLLNLSAYAPLKYVLPHKAEEYSRKYDNKISGKSVFRQVDREQSLIHLMRVNLFKRMESSINSFAMTLRKLLGEVDYLLEKIKNHSLSENIEEFDIEDVEIEDEAFSPFMVGKKIKVLIQDMDVIRWKQELEQDKDILENLIAAAKAVQVEDDEKLRTLKAMIKHKINNQINKNNKKIIVFTAFADTARYLYENIAQWAKEELSIFTALVTGSGEHKTEMPGIRKDLDSILTSFSPVSKERKKIDSELTDEIDLLIATDCISEGQNLQDCDYLINYDIHWNPVRIIQRFGRIDRLGSKNDRVQLVNYWPNMELDEYINLESRVSGRMVLLDISATGEENVIEFSDSGKMNDLEYRRKQMEKLQKEVVDIEDVEGGISITDLTLNDFRMDLSDYRKENENMLEKIMTGTFAVTEIDHELTPELKSGVIFCLKNESAQNITDMTYALSPYYLVYVSDDGSIFLQFTQAKKILDILKKISITGRKVCNSAVENLSLKTNGQKDMAHYRQLLAKAIQGLTGAAEERGVETLFKPGGTVVSQNSFKGIDDFEVVCYLILLNKQVSHE